MRYIITIAIAFLSLMILGCSSQSPVSSVDQPMLSAIETGQNSITQTGQIILSEDGNLQIVPDRGVSGHYNVTGWLSGGYFTYRLLGFADRVLTVELKIVNPTSLQVYDVRVMYTDLQGKTVLNPDGYTDLFGNPICPFTAFGKEYTRRAFPVGPGGVDTEILELYWPMGNSIYVGYLIEVSLGGNCDEPYKIEPSVSNTVPATGGQTTISAHVSVWQDESTQCWCDLTNIGGSNVQMALTGSGSGYRDYEYLVDVLPGMDAGEYPVLITAKEFTPNEVHLYNYAVVEVTPSFAPVKLTNDDINNYLNFTSKTIATYDDHVYVVFSEDANQDGSQEIGMKEFNGSSWGPKTLVSPLSSPGQLWRDPSIAINQSNGDLHVLYEGMVSEFMSLGYRKRIGTTWNPHVHLFTGSFCLDSQIDVKSNGEVHIVFQDSTGPFFCIYWIHDPGTGTFDTPFIMAMDSYSPMNPYYAPAIDHDINGLVHIPFTTGFNGANSIGYRRWENGIWTDVTFVLSDYQSMWQDITVAPDNKATMMYRKLDDQLWMVQWDGTWNLNEMPVTSGMHIQGIPNCDSDSQGNIHLAFIDDAGGDYDVFYTVMDHVSLVWSTPVNLSENPSKSQKQSLVVDENDNVHIIWQDNADGDEDIYYVKM